MTTTKDQKSLNYIVVCSGRLSNSLFDRLSHNPQSDWLSNPYRYIFFSEGVENGLFNGDDILNEYKRKVRRLYNRVTETSTMNIEIETLVMLTAGMIVIRGPDSGLSGPFKLCWPKAFYELNYSLLSGNHEFYLVSLNMIFQLKLD